MLRHTSAPTSTYTPDVGIAAHGCSSPMGLLTHMCRTVQTDHPEPSQRRLLRSAIRGFIMCARYASLPSAQVLAVLRGALALSAMSEEARGEFVSFGVDAFYGYEGAEQRREP